MMKLNRYRDKIDIILPYLCYVCTTCFVKLCLNLLKPSDAYMRQYSIPTLLQIMACRLFGAKPLSKPMLPYCQLDSKEHIAVKCYLKFKRFQSMKCTWTRRLRNGGHFVSVSMCWAAQTDEIEHKHNSLCYFIKCYDHENIHPLITKKPIGCRPQIICFFAAPL